jgi:putative Holliday junction resolvase
MGLDLGQKRIGIAVTDEGQSMAFPECVLERRSAKADRQALARMAAEFAIEGVVIGLPLSMAGEAGENVEDARRFGEYLGRVVRVPVAFQDERLTTVEAEGRLRDSGLSAAERRRRVDAAAAAIILEDYLRDRAAAGRA